MKTSRLLAAAAMVLCALLPAGCALFAGPEPKRQPDVSGIQSILVLGFTDMTGVYGTGRQVKSPLSGKMFFTGTVEEGAADFLTEKLAKFVEQSAYTLIPPEAVEGQRTSALGTSTHPPTERQLVLEIGRRANADAVLAGYVYRFREREGTAYAVDNPASVAFDLYLLRTADGRILWAGRYDETQQPLSENLLKAPDFVKRGGRWVKVKRLAELGLAKMLEDFPEK
ncbi:MAG: hypothetical protein JRI97_10090 [Deltaproteobacteria bacterium]|nr:hypothetical protein [Deltaproteobacteria bacterium]